MGCLVSAAALGTLQVVPERLCVPSRARRRRNAAKDREGDKSGKDGLHDGTPLIGRHGQHHCRRSPAMWGYSHHATVRDRGRWHLPIAGHKWVIDGREGAGSALGASIAAPHTHQPRNSAERAGQPQSMKPTWISQSKYRAGSKSFSSADYRTSLDVPAGSDLRFRCTSVAGPAMPSATSPFAF
jgi:hypothetical protein